MKIKHDYVIGNYSMGQNQIYLKYCTVDTHKEGIQKLRLIFWFREVKNCKLSMYIIIQRESPLIFIKNHGESS